LPLLVVPAINLLREAIAQSLTILVFLLAITITYKFSDQSSIIACSALSPEQLNALLNVLIDGLLVNSRF
jgi:hypothetical protein